MRSLVATVVGSAYALLAALHLYWLAGGRKGGAAVIPEVDGKPAFRPGPGATLLVAVALAAAAWLVFAQGGLVPGLLPASVLRAGTLVLGILFLLRAVGDFRRVGFSKKVRGTRFARLDDLVFSPLCVALGVSVLWLAL
jgi:hypothetical protein